jgi:hypothetical protein
MLAAKSWLGLNKSRFVDLEKISHEVGAPESEALAEKISDASVTLLRNDNDLLPLPAPSRVRIVTFTEEPNFDVGRELERVLQPHVAAVSLSHLSNESSREFIQQITAQFQETDVVLLGVYLSIAAWKGHSSFSPAVQEFLAGLDKLPKPVITVAFGDPYVLAKLPTTAVVMTPFTGAMMGERSIARAVLGQIGIAGKLPVTIPGKYKIGEGMQLFSEKRQF